MRLLSTEYDAEKYLAEIRGYNSLSDSDKMALQLPYIHTTLLVDELTKLLYEESGGKIKITERTGMRKDRYSSLSYNYYVAMQIENKMNKHQSFFGDGASDMFIIKVQIIKKGGEWIMWRNKSKLEILVSQNFSCVY